MTDGIYEQLITKLVSQKLERLDKDKFYLKKNELDKIDATRLFSYHLLKVISFPY